MLVFLSLTLTLLQAEPDLLKKSKEIASTFAWNNFNAGMPTYQWLDGFEILCSGPGANAWQIVDVRTRKERSLPKLVDQVKKLQLTGMPVVDLRGQILIWARFDNDTAKWTVTRIDGTLIGEWERHAVNRTLDSLMDTSQVTWSNDGKSIIEFELIQDQQPSRIDLWQRPLCNLKLEKVLPSVKNTNPFPNWADVIDLGKGKMIWASPPGMFQLEEIGPSGPKLIRQPDSGILIWNISKPDRAKVTQLKTEENSMWIQAEVSPSQKKIIWQRQTPDQTSMSLWITDLVGTNLRELGAIHHQASEHFLGQREFGEIRWIPGTSSVSFVYKGSLYRVETRN